jgi:50S ribosomal subunit-associated GTPase HflX
VQQVQSVKRILADLKLAEIPSVLALNKADLVDPEALEAAVRQARQLDSGETVVISAIKPTTLGALLEKAGAVLARNLAQQPAESIDQKSSTRSRVVGSTGISPVDL